MKNLIVITGGAGFVGTNLIERLIKTTNYKIISIDNYLSGSKKNHINNPKVKYITGSTRDIEKKLSKYKKKIKALFHFGEFSRIAQSFELLEDLSNSNLLGSTSVINFCKQNKIRIIYSATSAAFGNNFVDQNLSPYSFTKTTILNLILNYSDWFNLKYNVLYFYNVYGGKQILNHKMAAVIGIFESYKEKGKALPIVKPGTQTRIFTHVDDVIDGCIKVFKNNTIKHLLVRAKESYSILDVAKMFNHKYKMVKFRQGERFLSSFPKKIRECKIKTHIGKKKLSVYLKEKYESS